MLNGLKVLDSLEVLDGLEVYDQLLPNGLADRWVELLEGNCKTVNLVAYTPYKKHY